MATFGSRNPIRTEAPMSSVGNPTINSSWTDPGLAARFEKLLVGQAGAGKQILPFLQMYQAGLSPENRPAGVFLLLGPTGTGKTRTVEALAEAMHGSSRNLLRVDCGEFQMEHEVAKLMGAPPGYLGHRETQPLLSQARLNAVASERCPLSILLLDEIEKAAPSMMRILLGVLDRGQLRLGDNNLVSLERTIIFMTSNLGAESMQRELAPTMGFGAMVSAPEQMLQRLEAIGLAAAKKKFSPEFMNRIDAVVTYSPLDDEAIDAILTLQLRQIQEHIQCRLANRAFRIHVSPKLRRFLVAKGVSREYGARELKRTIQRFVLQPLSIVVTSGQAYPGSLVTLDLKAEEKILIRIQED